MWCEKKTEEKGKKVTSPIELERSCLDFFDLEF